MEWTMLYCCTVECCFPRAGAILEVVGRLNNLIRGAFSVPQSAYLCDVCTTIDYCACRSCPLGHEKLNRQQALHVLDAKREDTKTRKKATSTGYLKARCCRDLAS